MIRERNPFFDYDCFIFHDELLDDQGVCDVKVN